MTPEDVYRNIVKLYITPPREPYHLHTRALNSTAPNEIVVGRWAVTKFFNGFGNRVTFLFKCAGVTWQLGPVCVAVNGIDGEVFEIRWSQEMPDEDKMEIMMLVAGAK